jgi:hypothetical protein
MKASQTAFQLMMANLELISFFHPSTVISPKGADYS